MTCCERPTSTAELAGLQKAATGRFERTSTPRSVDTLSNEQEICLSPSPPPPLSSPPPPPVPSAPPPGELPVPLGTEITACEPRQPGDKVGDADRADADASLVSHSIDRRGIAARNRVAASIAPRSVKVSARASRGFRVVAMAEKPKILRENEKEAWLSEMEREGANPFKDPMAIVGILGITFPFVILAVAGAAGYIGQ